MLPDCCCPLWPVAGVAFTLVGRSLNTAYSAKPNGSSYAPSLFAGTFEAVPGSSGGDGVGTTVGAQAGAVGIGLVRVPTSSCFDVRDADECPGVWRLDRLYAAAARRRPRVTHTMMTMRTGEELLPPSPFTLPAEGAAVGDGVAAFPTFGAPVRDKLRPPVGLADGRAVGAADGAVVRTGVGLVDGCVVGVTDGAVVRSVVGAREGESVGVIAASCVGDGVAPPAQNTPVSSARSLCCALIDWTLPLGTCHTKNLPLAGKKVPLVAIPHTLRSRQVYRRKQLGPEEHAWHVAGVTCELLGVICSPSPQLKVGKSAMRTEIDGSGVPPVQTACEPAAIMRV